MQDDEEEKMLVAQTQVQGVIVKCVFPRVAAGLKLQVTSGLPVQEKKSLSSIIKQPLITSMMCLH